MITKDELDDILISLKEWVINAEHRLNRLEQPAQEPVAIVYSMQDGYVGQMVVKDIPHKTPLYPHPHQWQGLTDDEMDKIFCEVSDNCVRYFPSELNVAWFKALKDKNT